MESKYEIEIESLKKDMKEKEQRSRITTDN